MESRGILDHLRVPCNFSNHIVRHCCGPSGLSWRYHRMTYLIIVLALESCYNALSLGI